MRGVCVDVMGGRGVCVDVMGGRYHERGVRRCDGREVLSGNYIITYSFSLGASVNSFCSSRGTCDCGLCTCNQPPVNVVPLDVSQCGSTRCKSMWFH